MRAGDRERQGRLDLGRGSPAEGGEPFPPETDPGIVAASEEPAAEPEPEPIDRPPAERLESIVESVLFASDRSLSIADIAGIVGEEDGGRIEAAIAGIALRHDGRGLQLHPVAGGWQFRTDARNAPWVARLLKQRPVRLTRAQLETLAILAYRQPITRPEVDDIRGVDSGGPLKTLLERGLIRILGKKEEPGRPLLYGTTRAFLELFNLPDLRALPTLREFHELSAEHLAQVATTVPILPEPPQPLRPLERVELRDDELRDDLIEVDRRIDEASRKAQDAEKRLAVELAAAAPTDPPSEGTAGAATEPPPHSHDQDQG